MKYYRFDRQKEYFKQKHFIWYTYTPWSLAYLPQSSLCVLLCPAAWWRFLASSALRAATYILIPCAIEKTVYFFVLPFFFFSLNTITAGQWGVNLFQAFFKETFEEVWEMMQYRVGIVTVFLRLQYCQGMCLVQLGQPENKESFQIPK